MILAHTVGVGGPELELLIVAASLVILGVIFLVRRSVKPELSIVLAIVGLGLGIGAWGLAPDSSSARGITVSITAPADGATVPAEEQVRLQVAVRGAQLQSTGGGNDAGHLHIFVDDQFSLILTESPACAKASPVA